MCWKLRPGQNCAAASLGGVRNQTQPSQTPQRPVQAVRIEDTDQIGELLDLDNPAGAIGHAVIVAADRDKAIVADAPFQLEHGIETMLG